MDDTKSYLTEEEREYDEIITEAYCRMRKATSGARGQLVTIHDSFDFWVYKVTKEKYNKDG